MPRGDRTGPLGMGPRTGRGAGNCAGANTPGNAAAGFGRGRGGGRGWGRQGWGVAPLAQPLQPEEGSGGVQAQLEQINERLRQIEATAAEKR